MKKITSILLVACLIIPCAVMLTACGGVFSLKNIFNKPKSFSFSASCNNTVGFTHEIQSTGYYEMNIYSSYPMKNDITRTLSLNGKVMISSYSRGNADTLMFYCIFSAKKGDILSLNKGKELPEIEFAENYANMSHIKDSNISDVVIDLKKENLLGNLYLTNYYYDGFTCELPSNGYYHVSAQIYYNGYRFDESDTRYLKLNGNTIYERTIEIGNYPAVSIVDCYISAKQGDILSLSNGIELNYQYYLNISFIPYST